MFLCTVSVVDTVGFVGSTRIASDPLRRNVLPRIVTSRVGPDSYQLCASLEM